MNNSQRRLTMEKLTAGLCALVLLSSCCGMGAGGCRPDACGEPYQDKCCEPYPCHCPNEGTF